MAFIFESWQNSPSRQQRRDAGGKDSIYGILSGMFSDDAAQRSAQAHQANPQVPRRGEAQQHQLYDHAAFAQAPHPQSAANHAAFAQAPQPQSAVNARGVPPEGVDNESFYGMFTKLFTHDDVPFCTAPEKACPTQPREVSAKLPTGLRPGVEQPAGVQSHHELRHAEVSQAHARSTSPMPSGGQSTSHNAQPQVYEGDPNDLLDQHVAYQLRQNPDAQRRLKVTRKATGVYDLNGHEIQVEWQYADQPGEMGHLVCMDGQQRQPFSDYIQKMFATKQQQQHVSQQANNVQSQRSDVRHPELSQGHTRSTSPMPSGGQAAAQMATPSVYEGDPNDLLDQHVAYQLRQNPDAQRRLKVTRKSTGVYDLNGHEIQVEWKYADQPGEMGHLVCVDGQRRQPFSDYIQTVHGEDPTNGINPEAWPQQQQQMSQHANRTQSQCPELRHAEPSQAHLRANSPMPAGGPATSQMATMQMSRTPSEARPQQQQHMSQQASGAQSQGPGLRHAEASQGHLRSMSPMPSHGPATSQMATMPMGASPMTATRSASVNGRQNVQTRDEEADMGAQRAPDKDDLIDQHVHYALSQATSAKRRLKVERKHPGVYDIGGREVTVEWEHATRPGAHGHLVVIDGPLRQPFADYLKRSEDNAEYDSVGLERSKLEKIPLNTRLTFGEHHVDSRLDAMKLAKAQAQFREKAADYVNNGQEVPADLMEKYNKTLQQKLGKPMDSKSRFRPRPPDAPATPQAGPRPLGTMPGAATGAPPPSAAKRGATAVAPPGAPMQTNLLGMANPVGQHGAPMLPGAHSPMLPAAAMPGHGTPTAGGLLGYGSPTNLLPATAAPGYGTPTAGGGAGYASPTTVLLPVGAAGVPCAPGARAAGHAQYPRLVAA